VRWHLIEYTEVCRQSLDDNGKKGWSWGQKGHHRNRRPPPAPYLGSLEEDRLDALTAEGRSFMCIHIEAHPLKPRRTVANGAEQSSVRNGT
jgi:hypothetical protein